jgi:hypothetical protein
LAFSFNSELFKLFATFPNFFSPLTCPSFGLVPHSGTRLYLAALAPSFYLLIFSHLFRMSGIRARQMTWLRIAAWPRFDRYYYPCSLALQHALKTLGTKAPFPLLSSLHAILFFFPFLSSLHLDCCDETRTKPTSRRAYSRPVQC